MLETSQAVLCHAALSFVATEAGRHNPRLGEAMGLRQEQISRIRSLSIGAIMKMAAMSTGCVRLQFDPDALDELLADVLQEVEHDDVIEEFLRHGASREMMAELFAMTYRDYARARQALGVTVTTGRMRELSPSEAGRVLAAWEARGRRRDASTYLAVARAADLPLRMVWNEVKTNYPVAVGDEGLDGNVIDLGPIWPGPNSAAVE